MGNFEWVAIQQMPGRSYSCGHCRNKVASEKGYGTTSLARGTAKVHTLQNVAAAIWVCPFCRLPTLFDERGPSRQVPSPVVAEAVESLPSDVEELYIEAAKSITAGCPTAAVLVLRKILMHVAVEKGAPQNQKFVEYVDFIEAQHYVPPDGRRWLDHIRKKGNEATHEIVFVNDDEAYELLYFTTMLLKLVYEFPARMAAKKFP